MSLAYMFGESDGRKAITVFHGGEVYVASDDREDFDTLVEKARAGDESIVDLFEPVKTVTKRFVKFTDKVTLRKGKVYYDEEPIDSSIEKAILAAVESGEDDWIPLVMFLEKLSRNPEPHSREQLYRWLNTHKFTITSDGDILGYKGVRADGTSVSSGYALVNGREMNGNIPNEVGSTITMPRSMVEHDPAVGCHVGLHVGTFEYARGFTSGRLLLVSFSPEDVVSVPTDAGDAKVRVCRYKVLKTIDQPVEGPIAWDFGDSGKVDELFDSVNLNETE